MIPPHRIQLEEASFYFPYRDTCAVNVLETYKFGESLADEIKILFLGCGDLRNTLKTVSSGNVNQFQLHLNDSSPTVLARNILILKIITSHDFDTKKEEDVTFLWDVWYNVDWSAQTQWRFKLVLKELLDSNLPENVTIVNDSHLEKLRTVWLSWWLSVCLNDLKTQSEKELLLEKIHKERLNSIVKCWRRLHYKDVHLLQSYSVSSVLEAVDNFAFHLVSKCKDFGDLIRKKVHEEVRLFFSKGSCRLRNGHLDSAFVNPTMMLDPTTYHWDVAPRLSPFDSFLPLMEEELDMYNGEILVHSCQKILMAQVDGYRNRRETVKIVFYLEDSMEFCFSDATNLTFDVIDCSTLADNVGLVNLVIGSSKKLADTAEAILLTDSLKWNILKSSALEYVEEALCSPLSMIPTLYGMRLTTHIELGSPEPNFESYVFYTIKLCWQKVMPFRNVVPSPSSELNRWFQQLGKKCFTVGEGWKSSFVNDNPPQVCGMLSYTPLTFSYAVNSMIQRVGVDCFKDTDDLKLPSIFRRTRQTFEAWKNGDVVLKYSTVLKSSPRHLFLFKKLIEMREAPVFRLMLIPKSEVTDCYDKCYSQVLSQQRSWLTIPNAHVIDNFGIDIQKTPDGNINKTVVTFLLVSNHGIENTHCAVLFELISGVPIVNSGLVSAMRVTKYDQPYPWISRLPLHPNLSGVRMHVNSCIEDPYQYIVEIEVGCVGNISGLKVSTNQCLPCESTHDMTISLSQPNNIKPLDLSFPHPIVVNGINVTLRRKARTIELVLPKALWEPWPYEFQLDHCKLNSDCLKPWKKERNLLLYHLVGTVNPYGNPLSKFNALKKVREMIVSLFIQHNGEPTNQEYVRIQRKGSTQSPDWYIRIHLPLRITPLGAPLLILSAVDKRLTESLVLQGKLEKSRADEDLLRIWESPRCKKKGKPLTIFTHSPQEARLLRLVLRLNSTKITPSAWQRENLPLQDNSPWLATYISPLYQDSPLAVDYVESKISPSVKRYCLGEKVNERFRCAACQTVSPNLKQCARCRNIFYCNAECQRGDWAHHKKECSKH